MGGGAGRVGGIADTESFFDDISEVAMVYLSEGESGGQGRREGWAWLSMPMF